MPNRIEIIIKAEDLKKKLRIKDGKDGVDGKSVKGEPGKKGKDGSPDTAKQIVGKINSLGGIEALKGLDKVESNFLQQAKGFTPRALRSLYDVNLNSLTDGEGIVWDAKSQKFIPESFSTLINISFETYLKNLEAYPYTLTYSGSNVATKVFTVPAGIITATYSYSGTNLTSIVLSGNIPAGISKTKTLTYSGSNVSSVSYA